MFLTRECDYGLRAIRALAGGGKMTVEEICGAELVPQQYAYKILKKLERAGLVQSIRGREGGYILIKSLSAFTIYDVVGAVDDNLYVNECLREKSACPHKKGEERLCAVHREFERIQGVLISEMRRKTLLEVVSE